jgi:hypothetical protein
MMAIDDAKACNRDETEQLRPNGAARTCDRLIE